MNRRPLIAYVITLVFACMIGGAYWLISLYLHSDETFDTILLYRFGTAGGYGDSDYLPLIFALSRLDLNEFIVMEYTGLHGPPFPQAALSVHALLVAILGERGLVIADILVVMTWLHVMITLVRTIISDQVCCYIIVLLLLAGFQMHFTVPVLEFRLPRPFISNLFMIGLILTSFCVSRALSTRNWQWRTFLLHGTLLGLSAQSDLSLAMIATLVTLFLFVFNIFRQPFALVKATVAAVWVIGGSIVLAIPLELNIMTASDELLSRWGKIGIGRLALPMYLPHSYLTVLPGLLGMLSVLWLMTYRTADKSLQSAQGMFTIIMLFIMAAPLAMPLSCFILGEAIQTHHFIGNARSLMWLGCVSGALIIAVSTIHYVGSLIRKAELSVLYKNWYGVQLASLVAAGVVAVGVTGGYALEAVEVNHQPRVWKDGWAPFEMYRKDLDSLLRELAGKKYANARVLGTLDQQLGMWWVAVQQGFLFIPDTFLSTVRDEVIVQRTAEFMRLVGDNLATFQSRLQQEYFQNRFISLAKWQASALYTAAAMDQYSPDQIDRIRHTSVLDDMHVELPRSERDRLTEIFLESGHLSGKLDLIILPNVPGFEQLPGPPRPFVMVYQNPTFRVWERDELLQPVK